MTPDIVKVPSLGSVEAFRARLSALGLELPVDEGVLTAPESPMAEPLVAGEMRAGNRWCIQPMEGWDGTEDGFPTDFTRRRWQRFGQSGAKLIWGGEAVAVTPEGRANPNQLMINERTVGELARLRELLVEAHEAISGGGSGEVSYGSGFELTGSALPGGRGSAGAVRGGEGSEDLLIGLQLTHSGRFCRPTLAGPAPTILYRHPVLDRKFNLADDHPVMTDEEIRALIRAYGDAAVLAHRAGFRFVDLKHCHGYLGHEFLSAHTRPGPYGGSFENRTRFLREVVDEVRSLAPELGLAVRVSIFDLVPFRPDPEASTAGKPGRGVPEDTGGAIPYRFGFGVDAEAPTEIDLSEPARFLELLRELGIRLVNLSCASPYYNPHLMRPALFPPSDGYLPPEDPLVGCVRQVQVVRELKARFPDLTLVGTGYTYFQEYLPHVAQAVVRAGWVDAVGLGRMVLSYPELPRDTLTRGEMRSKQICRTFSDCTTAPRNGMVSGCYPLDPFYKESPLRKQLLQIKAGPVRA